MGMTMTPLSRNRVVRNPMRPQHRKAILDDVCYIFNITAQTWSPIYRTHGVTLIFGNDLERIPDDINGDIFYWGETETIKWSRTTIHGRIEYVENGIETSHGVSYDEVATESELIADDIVNFCNENRPAVES